MVLLISYDLNTPGKDYAGLYKELKKAKAWWHHLDSTWIIETNLSCSTWQKRIRKHLDDNDSFLIIEIRNNYQGWLPERAWDWLKNRKWD